MASETHYETLQAAPMQTVKAAPSGDRK